MANGHNLGKYYYEYRALFTLQKLFPKEYDTLVHGDKPDLYDCQRNMGIEVARGADFQAERILSFFQKHLDGRMLEEIPEDTIQWFRTNGCEVITGADLGTRHGKRIVGYIPEAIWFNTGNLERVIKQKVLYIDKTAWSVSELSLYVFSDAFKTYERRDIEELVFFMQEQQKKQSKQYRVLYVDDCGWFYCCDLVSGEIRFFDTDEILHDICVKAKIFAENND